MELGTAHVTLLVVYGKHGCGNYVTALFQRTCMYSANCHLAYYDMYENHAIDVHTFGMCNMPVYIECGPRAVVAGAEYLYYDMTGVTCTLYFV